MDKVSAAFELPIRKEPGGIMPYVVQSHGDMICVCDETHADAAIIAINAYPAMLEALEEVYGLACEDDGFAEMMGEDAVNRVLGAIALAKGE